jgi:hypothetical protein
MNDVEIMLQMLLLEDAEKHGLQIDSVRASDQYGYSIRVRFSDGHTGAISTRNAPKEASPLAVLLDLAKSPRGRFQLWTGAKRAREYREGIERASEAVGKTVVKVSHLSQDMEPEDFVTRKTGRTPGGRTYEVVDSPFGRRIVVVDEGTGTAAQRGPFVRSATKIFKLDSPTSMNGNTSRAKGWRRRAQLWVEPRTQCRFLETFVAEWNRPSRLHRTQPVQRMVPLDFDLRHTHDPAATYARSRNIARLACSTASGQELPWPHGWKKKDSLAFPREHRVFSVAWGISYYEDSVVRAQAVCKAVRHLFEDRPDHQSRFVARFEEVV